MHLAVRDVSGGRRQHLPSPQDLVRPTPGRPTILAVDGAMMRRLPGATGLVRFQHWAVPAHTARWSTIPVFYLTSAKTFSAAEHLAMVLKSTGRGILVGETTGGGNHFGGTEPVGDGLELYVPVGRTTDPTTGRDWEGTGVEPDVRTRAADALAVAVRMIDGVTVAGRGTTPK